MLVTDNQPDLSKSLFWEGIVSKSGNFLSGEFPMDTCLWLSFYMVIA